MDNLLHIICLRYLQDVNIPWLIETTDYNLLYTNLHDPENLCIYHEHLFVVFTKCWPLHCDPMPLGTQLLTITYQVSPSFLAEAMALCNK